MADGRALSVVGKELMITFTSERVREANTVDQGADPGEIVVRSPFDGREVGRAQASDPTDIDRNVALALSLHRSGPPPTHERAAVLDRAAQCLSDPRVAERFARLISDESAKPITAARVEVARAVDTFRFAAAEARSATSDVLALDASASGVGKLGFVLRVPVGVVAGICPFNFPLNLVAHKVAPAIAAGCPIVIKPASTTPLTALALADLLVDACGLPVGWIQVALCDGAVASHLATHDDVSMISFTGSPEIGWAIRAAAPRKRVGLELGNNAPVIIEPDADIAVAARKVALGAFSFAGQSCVSVQRVYVHAEIERAFTKLLVDEAEALVVGDPSDPTTDVSALIDDRATDRVEKAIAEAIEGGAAVACGGTRTYDGVLRPTVLTRVRPAMDVSATEIFGPVVGVARYRRFEDAVARANDTRYGLQAGVFTTDIHRAMQAARTLDFGGVTVNEVPTWRAEQMPYGGVRDSGNTREGPRYAMREMTEHRLIAIEG